MSASGSRRAILAAFAANLAIAVAKFVGFALTGASSMVSEGIHSVADTGNQGLLLLGTHRATKNPDEEHPFGYGRERFFWSFVVAVVLFTLGSVFAIYEGIHKIRHPEALENPLVAVVILGIAIVAESVSFRTAMAESRPLRGDATWWQFLRRSKIPELPVVLLEDAGALVGLIIALGAIGLTVVTGDAVFDGVGSVLIGVLLGVIAVFLAVEMKSLLIGESAGVAERRLIEAAITDSPTVVRLIHCRTEHIGPEQILVAAKVEFVVDLGVAGLADAVDGVEARIRAAVPDATTIYIEPDLYREHVSGR